MRKPLTNTQCIILAMFWVALCCVVITSNTKIDGPLIITILMSGALVFIPIIKSIKSRKK